MHCKPLSTYSAYNSMYIILLLYIIMRLFTYIHLYETRAYDVKSSATSKLYIIALFSKLYYVVRYTIITRYVCIFYNQFPPTIVRPRRTTYQSRSPLSNIIISAFLLAFERAHDLFILLSRRDTSFPHSYGT